MSHAVLAPSHAETWIACLGSPALCAKLGVTGKTSVYVEEGSAAHLVASDWLQGKDSTASLAHFRTFYKTEAEFDAAIDYLLQYVEAVRNAAEGKTLLVEQHLDVERWTGEKGGKGTSDAIILDLENTHMEVWDLKFGLGNVVYAENNKQEMLYALGALDMVEALTGVRFNTISLVIHQPRREHISRWETTREELLAFGEKSAEAGGIALSLLKAVQEGRPVALDEYLVPSEGACLWCPAGREGLCEKRKSLVAETVFSEFTFVGPEEISVVPRKIESLDHPSDETLTLVEDWCKAKREYIETRVRSGVAVAGWKMVAGKKGNRYFTDTAKVEKLLKSLKFKKDQIFKSSMISLSEIQKLVPKPKWAVFEKLIDQAPAKPIVVSSKNPKPEWVDTTSPAEFQNVEEISAFE